MQDITISTKSWHYRLYNFVYDSLGIIPSRNGNLCSYMRMLLLAPLVLGLIVLLQVFGTIFTFVVFGLYPTKFGFDADLKAHPSPRVFGFRILLWHPLLLGLFVLMGHDAYKAGSASLHAYLWFMSGPLLLLVGTMIAAYVMNDNAIGKQWLRAKTKGICPLVKFDDGDNE